MKATLKSIGNINTPYQAIEDCPNNVDPKGPLCQLVINEKFIDGLSGLQPGQKILILYWFENTDRNATKQESNNGAELIGTFALRSPQKRGQARIILDIFRPNAIMGGYVERTRFPFQI